MRWGEGWWDQRSFQAKGHWKVTRGSISQAEICWYIISRGRMSPKTRNIMSAFSNISDGDWDVMSVFHFIMLSSVLFSPLDTKALAEHQVQIPSDSYLSLIAPSRPCNCMDLNGTWRKANKDVSKAPNIWNLLHSELNLSLQGADHQCTLYVLFVFIHCVNSLKSH